MILGRSQEIAVQRGRRWLKLGNENMFVVTGPAGTGKTRIAKTIVEGYKVVYAAYTGKAAARMRESGCIGATTLHSLLYRAGGSGADPVLAQLGEDYQSTTNEDERARLRTKMAERRKNADRSLSWSIRPDSPLATCDVLVVDEFSMVTEKMVEDIFKVCRKVLFLGDPFQLPPVMGKELKLTPDVHLEEVFRQSLESPVLRAATYLREEKKMPRFQESTKDHGSFYLFEGTAPPEAYTTSDIVLTATNGSRRLFNRRFREIQGRKGEITENEKVIILKNDQDMGVFNGTTGRVLEYTRVGGSLEFAMDLKVDGSNEIIRGVPATTLPAHGFDPKDIHDLAPLDYAYALTCHKAQGSEWDTVMVHMDRNDMPDWRRWVYTAITRAKMHCRVVEA